MHKIKSFGIFKKKFITIILCLGFILWLFLGSITELLLPLDSLKKIPGIVSHVEQRTFNCRLSRGEIGECTKTIIRLRGNQSSFSLTGFDNEDLHFKDLKKGDSVDIYTRHWYQVSLSFNEGQKIYHLQKGNTVVWELFSRKPEAILGLHLTSMLLMIILLVFLPALLQV